MDERREAAPRRIGHYPWGPPSPRMPVCVAERRVLLTYSREP